jgi:hypothetical protein
MLQAVGENKRCSYSSRLDYLMRLYKNQQNVALIESRVNHRYFDPKVCLDIA